jgi:cell division protein FtsA
VEIIEARVYEIFSLCRSMLEKDGVELNLGAGVVLAGGGISYVDGNKQLAAEVFELPVRVAPWKNAGAVMPEMATAEGMIKYIPSIRKGNIGSEVKSISQAHKSKSPEFFDKLRRLIKSLF